MLQIESFHHSEDQLLIADLILNIQQKEFNVPITLQDQPDLLNIKEFYQKNAGDFWVAKYGDILVGTIALIDCGDGVGAIRKMFVKKEYRGSSFGIAQLLYDSLQVHALKSGFHSLFLGTLERLQAAIRFYERNGFYLINKEDLPSVFPLMAVDTHFYAKKL